MGLKVLTLSLCALTRQSVVLHRNAERQKEERAKVEVFFQDHGMIFFLVFEDGRREQIRWNSQMQGFGDGTETIDESDGFAAA